ncbi:OmpA family protein [Aliarcobacter cryaerophilus]|uniref:OmpA family protein n=1 Tax=Aliarcobacter cryaerophilus TaxID=28198 RepID=UPI0021B3D7BA|nr:OmpA family protein [Aliarcobacter cryaerophilus]MCT7431736.1 OmpA family protein [Aliarcobacter cryaerophilus]
MNILLQKRTIAVTTSCILLFGGCAASLNQNAGKIGGTAIGAGAGAVIGKQLGGDAGLVIGALVGGGIGYLIGNEIDTRRENLAKLSKEEKIEVVSQNIVQNDNQVLSQNSNEKVDSKNVIGDSFTVFSDEEQFALNSSNLSKKSEQVFGKIANEYKNSDKKILIIGHTDDSGNSSYNQKLSEDRAKNVGDIFSKNGVKKSNIYFLGAGENNPIANNNTIEGASKNRRVEIVELKSEDDILKYASKTSNPEFFKKVEPKNIVLAKNQKSDKVVSKDIAKTPTKNSKKEDNKKNIKIEEDNKKIAKTDTELSDTKQKESIKEISSSKDIFDFQGKKVIDNSFALKTNFGESIVQSSSFSFITKAQASSSTSMYQNCLADKPRAKADVKSLETNKVVHKTIDYKKGLNSVPFVTNINGSLIAISPVAVLENGSTVSTYPKATFYSDYKGEKDAKPTLELTTSINTYQGTQGLIYRVFFDETDTQMKCMDIVFDEKNVNSSKGILYYTKNSQIFEKEFDIARIK